MRITLLCLTLFFLSADSYAEVVLQCDSTTCQIIIKGLICPEDLSTFKRIIGTVNHKTWKIMTTKGEKRLDGYPQVHLDSPGGDVMTALAIGDLMYENQFVAKVDVFASCSSACVYILASSVMRLPLGSINIHRPYSNSIDTSFAQAASDFAKIERVAVFQFKRVGVSTDLWDAMMRVPPQAARELSAEEMMYFGLGGTDPAYADALDSASAKRLGITKQEYLRRKAIEEKCLEDEKAKYRDDYYYHRNYPQIYEYCQKLAGTK